jgi:hypothetical protein
LLVVDGGNHGTGSKGLIQRLTGEPLDEPFTTRPVISTINNQQKSLPQSSISYADIFYEIETEAAVTRGLAFFTDLSEVGPISSVRSARTYFNSIAYSYDGVLTHVGSSKFARNGKHDIMGNRLPVYDHIDWQSYPAYTYRDQDRLNAGCRRILHALFSDKDEAMLLHYVKQANSKFGGFFIGKLLDSFMVGLTCALLFTVFKIPYPILIATIIGVTDFIPFFGPFIGAIPSAVIILIASPPKAILFVVLILVVQQIDGNLIAPLILGDHTGLTSLGVLIAITLMGGLFGFGGLLLGVPLFALIMTILDDYLKVRLRRQGSPTDLYSYYPADAFIRPIDEMEAEHGTLTQRFVRWVCAVENEKNVKHRSPFAVLNHGLRRGLLNVGRFFYRLFTVRQIPEDRRTGLVSEIAKRGMTADRSFWRTLIFSVLTLGIYPIYLTEVIAESTNIACMKDGKRTWGALPVVLLSILTLGIYPILWHCLLIRRFGRYAKANGKVCPITLRFYLLWSLLGAFIVVGPFIAFARFLRAYNRMCETFNSSHTFPISRRAIEREARAAAAAFAAAKRANKKALTGEEDEFPWEVLDDLPKEAPPFDPTAAAAAESAEPVGDTDA